MKLDLNFASRHYVNRRLVSKAYWLVAIGLLCLLIWTFSQCLFARDQIQKSKGQLAVIAQEEREVLGTKSVSLDSLNLDEIRSKFTTNQMLLDQDSFRWTALFDRMEILLPAGVSIRRFQPDYEKQSLAIEGVAKNLSALQQLLDRLLEADTISNAYLQRQSETKVRDTSGKEYPALSFSISLEGVF